MICPVCYAHLRRSHVYSLSDRLIKFFTAYRPFTCYQCNWQGRLSTAMPSNAEQIKQTLLGWVLGVAIALGIAWFMVGELQTQNIRPSDASAEIKLFGR